MKIGILTQPLQNNYGGLLQNYALQKVLRGLGHEVYTINLTYKKKNLFKRLNHALIRVLSRITGRRFRVYSTATQREAAILFRHTRSFVKNHIQTTGLISQKLNQKMLSDYAFEAYIVGSDQVWRPRYSPQLPSFFLDFLADNAGVRKIAYAASFGVSDWEFSEAQTSAFGRLLRLFDAVSVREDSGVALCRQYFGLEATRLPDPSLLLTAEDYSALAAGAERQTSPGELYTYILDRTDDKDRVIGYLAKKHHWQPFTVMPDKNATPAGRRIQAYVFPPVEEWLRAFAAARFVVTDSFHGTVFSILFNKPFITLANQGRGLSRFSSLLKLFQLEDRLVQAADESALDKLDKLNDIDWPKTRRLLQGEREKALRFLTTCLAN